MRKPAVTEELDALLEELGRQAFDFEDAGDPVSALGRMREKAGVLVTIDRLSGLLTEKGPIANKL